MIIYDSDYKIDIVFVIDATRSLSRIAGEVRDMVSTFGDRVRRKLESCNRRIKEVRVRVVDFADFADECDETIHETEFFSLPARRELLENAVDGIDFERGDGDKPKNGLEALFVAMNSDWTPIAYGERGRHIIVLITGAYPLHLMERKGVMGYADDFFPSDIEQMQSVWDDKEHHSFTALSRKNKRLILFAPMGEDGDGHGWHDVLTWNNTVGVCIDTAKGLRDCALDDVLNEIIGSF